MRVYLNRKPIAGPWGGGSKVLRAVVDALVDAGHEVVHELVHDIDVLFCIDPRQGQEKGLCGYAELWHYANSCKRPIVQRVGDVGTHGKPELTALVLATAPYSNAIVFPSYWAQSFVSSRVPKGSIEHKSFVIQNAPLPIFYEHRKKHTILPKSISFVTHHWSMNAKKGFELYEKIDAFLKSIGHSFTFIGRVPDGIKLSRVLGPLDERALCAELPRHDVYITASKEEAGANHVLEGAAAGLPPIYSTEGGSIIEYCSKLGVAFDGTMQTFPGAVDAMVSSYEHMKDCVDAYVMTVEQQAKKYVGLIEELHTTW
jgi:hypothetical protein